MPNNNNNTFYFDYDEEDYENRLDYCDDTAYDDSMSEIRKRMRDLDKYDNDDCEDVYLEEVENDIEDEFEDISSDPNEIFNEFSEITHSEYEPEDVTENVQLERDIKIASKMFLNRDTCKNPLLLSCYHAADEKPPLPLPSDVVTDINVYSDTDRIMEYIKMPGIDPKMKRWFESLVIAKNIRAIYYAVIRENSGWTSVCSFDEALSAALSAVYKAINMYDANYVNENGQKTKFSTYMIKFVRNEVKKTHSRINTILKHERSIDVPLDTDEKKNLNAKSQVELLRDHRRNPEEELMSTESAKTIYTLFSHLDCMERFVMIPTLGLTRTRNSMTQVQIGEYSGNSQANISKIKADAEAKLMKIKEKYPEYVQMLRDAARDSVK